MSHCSISRHPEVATPPAPPTAPSGTDKADKQHNTYNAVKYTLLASHTIALTTFKSIQYKSL